MVVHQSTQSADEFDAFANELADSFKVIAVDLPGHGCSGDPDHELTIDEFAAATLLVIADLGLTELNVLGHHGGGMVAVALAANHPHTVRRLVISGVGIPEPELRDRILNQPMSRDLPLDADGEFLLRTWSIYRDMSAPGSSPEHYFKPFSISLRARLRPFDMHRETMLFDYPAALRRVQCPTLMIRAKDDHFAGDIDAANALVAQSAIADLAAGSAWLYSEQPTASARLVADFLT